MARKMFLAIVVATLLVAYAGPAVAQESSVKGNLAGTVYDTSNAVVSGAKVTLTGATGSKSLDSDSEGNFSFPLLIPGLYSVKVEKQGFKVADVKSIEVFTNRTATIRVTLEPGAITQTVEVVAGAEAIDTTSTGIGANLSNSFYQQVPVQRGIAGLFYLSPGVASGGQSGSSNPSISGGSGLENLYVADGVNITDASFGGLGVFNRFYGSLGSGITLSFVKEVQVKTGGYEPQYGKATGGIVQIVTKSGGNEYHGAIAAYLAPQRTEATRLHPDDFGRTNLTGKTLHYSNYDLSGELGGYVPGMRDHLFFFASFNPTWQKEFVISPPSSGLFSLGERSLDTRSLNYAAKGTFKINDSHSVEASIFGDPATTNTSTFRTLNIDNHTADSKLEYGTRNFAVRWNAALTPRWLVNASFTWGHTNFTETPSFDLHQIVDRTQAAGLPGQRGIFTAVGLGPYEPTIGDTYGFNVDTTKQFRFGGGHSFNIGYRLEKPFFDGVRTRSGPNYNFPATNAAGASVTTLGVPASAIGAPALPGFSLRPAPDPFFPVGHPLNPASTTPGVGSARECTLCAFMVVPGFSGPGPGGAIRVFLRGDRNEINFPFAFQTQATYHSIYAMDSWSPSKYVTLNLGLRWEQHYMQGGQTAYTFTGNWSPRLGVSVDPWGDRRTKVYASFGRNNYAIPLDMALRSLTNEVSVLSARWAPQFTINSSGQRVAVINSFGTVNPALDAAHLLNRVRTSGANFDLVPGSPTFGRCINAAGCGTGGGLFFLGESTTPITPGTKMQYIDEFVVGFEHEFKGGIVFSARYIDRRMKRIVEDMSGISPEASNAGVNQAYVIGNVGSNTDLFTNPISHLYPSGGTMPAACDPNLFLDPVEDTFGNIIPPGAVCYELLGKNGQLAGSNIPDGVPDGFPQPSRNYTAVEIEVNKSFSRNWQMRANWRIAKLFGNFEGAFRNDNNQTDPSISSLFDFVPGDFGLLGDQFKPGVLNTDRRHIVNGYVSYVLDKSAAKGLTLGVGLRVESGTPISRFKAHPAYLNSGEVPTGGRGVLGRTPVTGSVDAHVDYPWTITEKKRLRFGVDLFNLGNSRRQLRIDQDEDASFGTPNVDFLKPLGRRNGFLRPFYARFLVRFEF